MLVLMQALRERGHDVELACPEPPPDANRSLRAEAEVRGLGPRYRVAALRSALAFGDGRRVRALRAWLEEGKDGPPVDVVHCWHGRDHVLAARALRLGGLGRGVERSARLVRSVAGSEAIPRWPWHRWLYGVACDGVTFTSASAAASNRGLVGRRPIEVLPGAVDFGRLGVRKDRRQVRAELGIADDAPVVGVVARMQAHRRFDLLLDALRRIAPAHPAARLLVLGRGTHADRVVREPAARAGVADRLILAGHRRDDYADVLAATDVFTYLVPGSDGSCRALLQAAALGLPLVGTARGAIAEILRPGETGLRVEEDGAAIAEAWATLFSQPALRRRLGEAARRDAAQRFAPERLARVVEAFYAGLGRAAQPGVDSAMPISSR
jgi:glycosyltransferase involved in cell wall biosynthesis